MAMSKQRWLTVAIVTAAVALAIWAIILFMIRPTYVPPLVGTPASEVASSVAAAGLKVGDTSQVATTSVGPDVVVAQSPAPTTKVPRRSSVDITSSVAPVPALVPNLMGVGASTAVRTLSGALFVPYTVAEFSSEVATGVVIEQFPVANADWMTGRPVALGVSVGPDDGTGVKVPDLKWMTPEEVGAALEKAGLTGSGMIRDLGDAEANQVVAQLPYAGTVVRPGTTVLMFFVLP